MTPMEETALRNAWQRIEELEDKQRIFSALVEKQKERIRHAREIECRESTMGQVYQLCYYEMLEVIETGLLRQMIRETSPIKWKPRTPLTVEEWAKQWLR